LIGAFFTLTKNDLSSQGVQPAWPQMNQGGGEKWGCTDEFPVPA
jgi:hypothetical protein